MVSTFRLFVAVVCITAAASTPALAQTGTIEGTVYDPEGRPLQGATVQLDEGATGTATGSDGAFELPGVAAGSHTIVARFIGFQTEQAGLSVSPGATTSIEFVLEEDPLGLSEVVVSGAFNPATKLESSSAITTLNARQIDQRAPRGTSDLLRSVPGIQVNSTYGEIGADVTVRGLPLTANSSYRYVSLQEDGLPVFEAPGLLFAFPDAMLRVDETVSRMEAVRGGSAAVFTSNTPGGIVNFISKTGGSELAGTVRLRGGTHGLFRQDANLGGPLSEEWRFNVGGYYRYDRGLRPHGYPANRGGQIKANVTREIPRGYVRLYGKYLNEKNVWYMGVPIRDFGDPEPIPGGPEIGSGTTYSGDRLVLTVPDAYNPGGFAKYDMSDGYVTKYRSIGLEVSREMGSGWFATLRSRFLHSENRNNLMIDVADAFPITGFGAPGLPPQVPRFVRFVNSGETITDPEAVANLNGNGLMSVWGVAFVDQPVSNYISKLQLTREVGGHSLNTGLYVSGFRSRLKLVQQGVFVDVKNNPHLVQIMIPGEADALVGLTNAEGFAGYNTGYWNLENYTTVAAAFLGDTWTVNERLTVDAGGRVDVNYSSGANERPVVPGSIADGMVVGQEVPPGYPSFTPTPEQSAAGMFGSGRYRTWDYTFRTWGASIGLNYQVTDQVALYGRGSRGARAPSSQQWTFQTSNGSQVTGDTNKGEIETILQAETGIKVIHPRWSVLLTGFYGSSKNLISNLHRGRADGSFAFVPIIGDTRTIGVELEGALRPLPNLRLQAVTTIQDPRFTRFEYDFFVPGEGPQSGAQARDYAGNYLNDAVRVLVDLTAGYTLGGVDLFATFRYTGERYANRPNTIAIPSYNEVTAGASYTYERIRFGVYAKNLFDTQAISLMASRTGEDVLHVNDDGSAESLVTSGPAAGTTTQNYFTTGQGILPRSVVFSLGYEF